MRNKILLSSSIFLTLLVMLPLTCLADCTSFCFSTKDALLFGNNLDSSYGDGIIFVNKRNILKTGFLFDSSLKWVSKYGSITINQAGREFPSRGMNEKGLVIGEMTLRETEFPMPDSRSAVFMQQWIQYLLDNCAAIEEVIEANSKIRIAPDQYPSHYLIADSSGNCITMEWLNGKLISHTGKNLSIKVLTNSTYTESIAFLKRHKGFGEDQLISNSSSSLDRFIRAANMIKNHDPKTQTSPVDYAFDILANVANPSASWGTKWSLVYDIKNRMFYFRTNKNQNIGYVDFKSFNFSCETPVKMFNINKEFKGNTQDQFIDYDSDLNYKLIYAPASLIKSIANYPKTTVCNPDYSILDKQR